MPRKEAVLKIGDYGKFAALAVLGAYHLSLTQPKKHRYPNLPDTGGDSLLTF